MQIDQNGTGKIKLETFPDQSNNVQYESPNILENIMLI